MSERPTGPAEEGREGLLDWLSARLNLTEIFSLLTSYGLFYAELDPRKPLREALAEAADRPMVSYARWPRVLGLVVVVVILAELVTGIMLALYYLPTPESAYGSVGTLIRQVDFGWFVHQAHFWGAQLLIAVLVVRIVRFFVQGVYRSPRELVWIFACLLLLVCFHLDLTGRLLPYTQRGYWSTVRALEVAAAVPLYGGLIAFLAGAAEGLLSSLTLIRFYILHVATLPFVAVTLVYLHFSTVRRVGLTTRSAEPQRVGAVQVRVHVLNLAILLCLVVGMLVTLAVLVPSPYSAEADPYHTAAGIGPPWYLLAPFGFLELTADWLPRSLAGSILTLVFLALLLLPFWPRRSPGPSPRALRLVGLVSLFLLWALLTWYGGRVA